MATTPRKRRDDPRYVALRRGIEQLNLHQLTVLARHMEQHKPIVLDGCNYDPVNRTWCPLAVALEVDREAQNENREFATDAEAKKYIVSIGRRTNPEFCLNPMSGVVGNYFTSSRRRDLLEICREVLEDDMFCQRSS